MATLQNLRNRGKIIAAIIFIALLAFVIGDFLNSGSTFFHQSRNVVGEINGEKFKYDDYTKAIDQLTNVYKIEYNISEIDEQMNSQIRKGVWDNFINEKILETEAAKIGLSVSKDELTERLIGKNIHPLIMQRRAFVGENGQFSQAALMQFYNSIFNNTEKQSEEAKQQLEQAKSYWLFWEKAVKIAILQEKYAALFAKTAGSSKIEAKYAYDAGKETGDVNYVVQPYFSVSDSSIQVSNEEVKTRYQKNKELFKQDATRSINYVQFEVAPLPEDFKKADEWMKKVSEEFKTSSDVESLVNAESDISYTGQKYSAQTIPSNLKDFAFSGSTGAIYGPVFQNNTHTMAKIIQSGIMESDSLKLSHIVVATEKTADSIMNAIKSGANFAALATKHSLAQQTAAKGGEIGWIPLQAAGTEIEEQASNKGAGEIFKIVAPQGGGVQIFKIDEKSPARRKVQIAILERKVTPSDESQVKIFNNAKQFAAASTSVEKFEQNAKAKGYSVRPATNIEENAEQVNMIPQSRAVVRWTFKNDKDKVSDVIECGNDNFVVATVSEINSKGYKSLEKATTQLKAEIIKDKKAEIITKQLTGLIAKNPTIEGLATAMATQVKIAPAINFISPQFGEAGPEPYVIGKASVLAAGKMSLPLTGNAGVYVIVPSAKQSTPVPFDAKMMSAQIDRAAYSLPYTILEKLKDKYEVKDNRSNFY